MKLIDTHCHLDFDAFDQSREMLLEKCADSGIAHIILPSVSTHNFSHCLELGQQFSSVHTALGLHPYFIDQHSEQDLDLLEALLVQHRDQVCAIGEIGLDDTIGSFERQCWFFEKQLDMAERHAFPVIMHMRKHHGHGLKRVKSRRLVGGVVHAFSGSLQDAQQWVDLGIKIGVGGVITYARAQKTRRTIANLPLESIVLETDSPDMAVQGIAKGKGSPLMTCDVFDALCSLRSESKEQIQAAVYANTVSLFGRSLGV